MVGLIFKKCFQIMHPFAIPVAQFRVKTTCGELHIFEKFFGISTRYSDNKNV